jgi:WD40 repeat protein
VKKPRLKWPAGYDVTCSNDGRLVAFVGRNVVVIDMEERRRASTSHPVSHPSSATFAPDGRSLAVKATSGRIVTLDPLSGGVLYDQANAKEGEGSNLLFSPSGEELVDGSWSGYLSVRSARDGQVRGRDQFPGEMITRVSCDRLRRIWLVEHSPRATDQVRRLPSYATLMDWPFSTEANRILRFGVDFQSATLSPDGSRIGFIERNGERRIHIARASDGEVVACSPPTKPGGTGSELAWSGDGRYLASVQAGAFVLYDAANLSNVGKVHCQFPSAIAFLPGDTGLVLGSWETSGVLALDDLLAGEATLA